MSEVWPIRDLARTMAIVDRDCEGPQITPAARPGTAPGPRPRRTPPPPARGQPPPPVGGQQKAGPPPCPNPEAPPPKPTRIPPIRQATTGVVREAALGLVREVVTGVVREVAIGMRERCLHPAPGALSAVQTVSGLEKALGGGLTDAAGEGAVVGVHEPRLWGAQPVGLHERRSWGAGPVGGVVVSGMGGIGPGVRGAGVAVAVREGCVRGARAMRLVRAVSGLGAAGGGATCGAGGGAVVGLAGRWRWGARPVGAVLSGMGGIGSGGAGAGAAVLVRERYPGGGRWVPCGWCPCRRREAPIGKERDRVSRPVSGFRNQGAVTGWWLAWARVASGLRSGGSEATGATREDATLRGAQARPCGARAMSRAA
ncbi:hypothetical protein HNP84_004918 [Thermocatellispora tengchongensis]|uniref:Uncharacterized protein n=1 Tax=Thermocatellispora tengchongensis TaxID=1073253 RepID=A0A840P788_9ACTN|nr:hypothetical protein [Thermocatellispora tengchongensis]